jgi:2-polyprenyl-3-methyl-5-hydroxy-6-metoxy-1,4-benzoquinol methylase
VSSAAPLRRVPAKEWWRTEGGFFLLTEAHRAEEGPRAADFLEAVAGLEGRTQVLDVGCGWGRLSIELARRGHRVVGLDCSRVLALGRVLARQASVGVDYVRADMRRWVARPRFDLAVLWGMSFGYFDDEVNQDVLARVAASLAPGGTLVLDLHHRDWYLRHYLGEHVELVQGKVSHDEASFDTKEGRLNILSTVADGQGKVLARQWHSFREYTPREVQGSVRRAGLEVVSVHSGLARRPGPPRATHSSWQLVARRPEGRCPRLLEGVAGQSLNTRACSSEPRS